MKMKFKKALLTVGILGLSINAFSSDNGFFKYEVIKGKFINKTISTNPEASEWSSAEEQTVYLYPQVSVRLNDKKANAEIPKKQPVEAKVKVLYNNKNIAIYIRWEDKTPSIQKTYSTTTFGDGVSIEFPVKYGNGTSLPYVGMGDENHPVVVYLQKNVAGRDYQKVFISEGFGSLTETKENGVEIQMKYKNGEWVAVFKRPLKTGNNSLASGLVPIAFAIWDGNKYERDGNKSLSRWKFIKLDKYPLDKNYLSYVSWGTPYIDWKEKGKDIGNAENGKKLFQQNCAGCHRTKDFNTAQKWVYPNLSNIGGIANASYLKESILKPSAVVIRNLNPNRHYSKSMKPDKFKAYPNNAMYNWYINVNGKKQSIMPAFTHLKEKDINDIISYLKTQNSWKNFK